jgi:hypothetical protein
MCYDIRRHEKAAGWYGSSVCQTSGKTCFEQKEIHDSQWPHGSVMLVTRFIVSQTDERGTSTEMPVGIS